MHPTGTIVFASLYSCLLRLVLTHPAGRHDQLRSFQQTRDRPIIGKTAFATRDLLFFCKKFTNDNESLYPSSLEITYQRLFILKNITKS